MKVGDKCPVCEIEIPFIKGLDDPLIAELRKIAEENKIRAITTLKQRTGCGLGDAKLVVFHLDISRHYNPEAFCRHCGERLRTQEAKQCPGCFRSWHDEVQNDG